MQHLSKSELLSLLRVAKDHSNSDWLMLLVSFRHGLRASEVVGSTGLRASQINGGFITVQRLKGSYKTTQPLLISSEPLLNEREPLEALAKESNGLLFPVSRVTFWNKMQKYCRLAGIPKHKAHPHVMKHTCAMLAIKEAGIENVRQYLGHKSISSTGAYLKVDDEAASSAIAKAMGV